MMNHLCAQVPYLRILKSKIADKKGAGGDIDDCTSNSLVEGSMGIAKTTKTFAVTETFLERLTETEKCVFDGVVVIN